MKRQWIQAPISNIVTWDEGLMTLTLDCDVSPCKAGQFIDLGHEPLDREKRITRSYSLASAPGAPPEIYVVLVEEGALTPMLFERSLGDLVWVRTGGAGIFTLDRVPDAKVLWLLSTGTGLAPYIAMLRTDEPWERFDKIISVNGARLASQLGYLPELAAWAEKHPGKFVSLSTVTRDAAAKDVLHGRITNLLVEGVLEEAAGAEMRADNSHVLLCGNPAMLEQMQEILGERGMKRNTPKKPGQYSLEAYW